jgi:hypothetical protein
LPVTKNGAQRASRHRSILLVAVGLALGVLVTVSPLTVGAVSKPWYGVEVYYYKLLNCTRTGGWVLSNGSCSRYGSGYYSKYVAPIKLSWPISDYTARPYARGLATKAICSHFAGSDPATRLRADGFVFPTWGENIGCRDGYASAYTAVLASHRVFQAEKSSNGGHWRNMKNPRFKYVGVGVWKYNGRTRLVTDFVGW